jgi:uncharacterized protein YjbJ (UPF0337 family)
MNKDKVKGAVDQVVGKAKRRFGGWTGNVNTQANGLVQQVTGKVETARGELKDVVREALDSTTAPHKAEPERCEVILAENHNLLQPTGIQLPVPRGAQEAHENLRSTYNYRWIVGHPLWKSLLHAPEPGS